MSDWENDDFDAPTPSSSVLPVVANRGQWDDEDQDDEVKESWEASDASGDDGESKTPLSATLTSNTKKKMTLKEKIVEREAEAKKMKIDAERKKAALDAEIVETPAQRRARLEKAVKASDFENTRALFGDLNVVSPKTGPADLGLLGMNCKTKEDFDAFTRKLMAKVTDFETSSFYNHFVTSLISKLVAPLIHTDVRKLAQVLTQTALIKQRESKAQTAKPKKPLGAKLGAKSERGFDATDYGDFMVDEDEEEVVAAPVAEGRAAKDYDFM